MGAPTERPLRADAQRNRDGLLASSLRLFSEAGTDVTLEAVAKDAGVGIGTLYRHFPTREALIEATYRNELAVICDAVPLLLAEGSPEAAMRAWMRQFVDFMTAKSGGMGEALKAVVASGGDPFATSRDRLGAAMQQLIDACAAAGVIRADVNADDVLVSISGVALAAGDPSQREQAGRLLDLLMDGVRFRG
jgi:AcrR family transcriptional regulator